MRTAIVVINWLFGKLPILKWLDGKKTYIGFILWLISFIAEGLVFAAGFFPEAGLGDIQVQIVNFLKVLEDTLHQLGIDMMIIGVGHKATKEKAQANRIEAFRESNSRYT